jgi:acyl-CoA thioester hydrolase
VLEIRERSIRFEHEMVDETSGAVAARTTLKAVHLDAVARRSVAFADAVVTKAKALLAVPATA